MTEESKPMAILPDSKLARVEFFEAHIAAWVAGADFLSNAVLSRK